MEQSFERTEMLIGKEGLRKLAAARVAVFGVGGVGGYVSGGAGEKRRGFVCSH